MRAFTLACLLAPAFIATATTNAQSDFEYVDGFGYLGDDGGFVPPLPPIPLPPPPVGPCGPMFDDLPLHSPWYVPDTFTSHGLTFDVAPFQWSSGVMYNGGKVYADNKLLACGDALDLLTNNANVHVSFPTTQSDNVSWNFGEYGGNINLMINGDYRNVDNYMDLHGNLVGGVMIHIAYGGLGNDCGRIELHGVVEKLMMGGQEHWIDCIQFASLNPMVQPPAACNPCFEDLPLGSAYHFNDHMITSGWKVWVAPFQPIGAPAFFGGVVLVENAGQACGVDHELATNNAVAKMKPASGGAVEDVYFRFGEYGGNINFEINGDFRVVDNMIDLHNMFVGGVRVEVLSGGHGNDCGDVQLHGIVHRMALGGQEFWFDCLSGEAVAWAPNQGDTNGDGKADIDDLAAIVHNWGSSMVEADLDGSGKVDMGDLILNLKAMRMAQPTADANGIPSEPE
jgi:hypothetical protein